MTQPNMGIIPHKTESRRAVIGGFARWSLPVALSLLAGILSGVSRQGRAAEIEATEHDVKAAYLFQFGVFVDWPTNRFAAASTPVVVGVIGDEEIARSLEGIARTEKLKNRNLKVVRLDPGGAMPDCHILFVGERPDFEEILAKVDGRSVLTVGEQNRFAEQGGMINLVRVRNQIKWDANPGAIERAKLRIRSQVLSYSRRIVKTEPE